MSQTGYTPILIYSSTTASTAPSASNLTNSTSGSELAINITDGKLYYKDNGGVVQVLASKAAAAGVLSFQTSLSGLTPSTATNGAVTLAGTLGAASGGTGATTLTGYVYGNGTSAMTASTTIPNTSITGLGTMSTQNANSVAITGGSVNGTTIGASTASTGAFTTLSASSTVSGTGFSTYLSSPPAIGNTAANTGAFTTLTNTGTAYLGLSGGAGTQSLQVTPVASGVNYLVAKGQTAGNRPIVGVDGSDTNIGILYLTKNAENHVFSTNSINTQFVISPTASAVNYMVATGSATGFGTNLSVVGSDTNIDMYLIPKGTGGIATYSTGQTTASLSTTTLGSGIGVFDTGGLAGNGGSVIFGAASGAWRFAAIKSYATNGSSNTQGDLYFSTRRVATDSTLTPAMQITYGGIAYLGGSSGNQSLQVTPVASAVNYVQVAGAATGVAPVLSAQGSDANVSMIYTSKGTYGQGFYTNNGGQQQFSIAHTASAVNYLQVTGGSTGNTPSFAANGSDTNIGIVYTTKGTGAHYFYTNSISTPQFVISNINSAVNYLQVTGASTGNAVALSAQGSDTNIGISITSKGTGTVVIPNSNLGIGTSSPSYKLHVSSAQGSLATQSTTITNSVYNAFINGGGTSYVGVDTSTGSTFGAGSYGFTIYNAANSATTFVTNSTERMRITSSGNVLVGQTAAYNAEAFNVTVGSGQTWAASLVAPTYIYLGSVTSTTGYMGYFQTSYTSGSGGTYAGAIVSTGSSTAYGTSSDYRLKENVQPMTGALGKVQALKPVTFTWKTDGRHSQGFIAHELQAIVPEAVIGEKDELDEKGKPRYQGIDTSFLVATLTAAIQEQQALITTLQAQVAALQTKVGV
jgi:hypothetical protein